MQSILVNVIHHPVERRNVTVIEVPFHRQTIGRLKEQVVPHQDVLAGINGRQVDDSARVSAGDKVVFISAAADPATFTFMGIEGLGWWAIGAYVAVSIGLSYLGGVLFGPDMKQPDDMPAGQSFGWKPRTTRAQGGPHPMCWGKNMHHGNIVARWTDVDVSGNEILYMILDYSRGPVKGITGTVYFNDQPSTSFPGVTIQERTGTMNQTAMTGFEKNKLEYTPEGWQITHDGGPRTWTSPNNFFDDLEYTFECSRGLWYRHKSGGLGAMTISMKVEISERDEDDWTTIFEDSISGLQFEPLYKAYKVSEQGFNCVHGKQYELKFTRVSADNTSERISDEIWLRSVREVVDVAFTRPGKALLGITAPATSSLSGNIDVKFEAEDRLVNIFNGTSWSIGFSRNRAWVDLDALTQPAISGDGNGGGPFTIERYEGIDPSRVDLAFFYEWASWCADQVTDGSGGTEDRMTCDHIVDYATNVWELIYSIAQIGRMYPYWQGSILTGWVDKAENETFDLVTFDNVMVRSWKNSWAGYGEKAGGIEVFYQDALHGYERKSRPIPNEESGDYTRIVAVEGIGVKSHTLATRVGNHALQRNKLIKNINSVRMHKDALRYRLGKVVRLQSNVPNWGATYRVIKSEAANTVELDRACTASPGDIIYIRSFDEVNQKVAVDSYTVDSVAGKVVTIAETWDVTPVKNNIFAVGAAGAIKTRRIINMRHTADNYFDVEFETYDADLHDSDSIDPQVTDADYACPQPPAAPERPLTRWDVLDLISKVVTPQIDVDSPATSNCTWTGDDVDTVSWSKTDAAEPIIFRYKGTSYEITPDSTTDEFIYWDPDFTTLFKTTNDAAVAVTLGKWYMCRNVAGVAYPTVPFPSVHAGVLQAATITAAYGQIADAAIETAKIKDLAVETLKIKDEAVTVPASVYTAGAVNPQTLSFTTSGKSLFIHASFRFTIHWTSSSDTELKWYKVQIKRDTTVIFDSGNYCKWGWASLDLVDQIAFGFTDDVAAGTYTYSILLVGLTGDADYGASNFSLFIIETKK